MMPFIPSESGGPAPSGGAPGGGPGTDVALDSVDRTQRAAAGPEIVRLSGSGKAFQFVAQAAAMAVQDATDNLRNISTVSSTAIAVALSQLMSSGDTKTWLPVIDAAQRLITVGTDDFARIGATAATVVRNFPPGPATSDAKPTPTPPPPQQ